MTAAGNVQIGQYLTEAKEVLGHGELYLIAVPKTPEPVRAEAIRRSCA